MRVTGSPVPRSLWLLLALTSPLFGTELLRFNNEELHVHIAIPTLMQFAIMGTLLLGLIAGTAHLRRPPAFASKWGRLLLAFVTFFLLWHVVGMTRAFDSLYAAREVLKLGLGFLTFVTVVAFFPRDARFLERFWQVAIWGAAGLLGYLVYLHAFVFGSPQLAGVDRLGREGVNQLTGHIVFVLPYAIAWVWGARREWRKRKMVAYAPLLIIVTAWIYAGSRGAWIAVLAGSVVMAFELWRAVGSRKVLGLLLILSIVGGASLWAMNRFIPADYLDFVGRARYLYDPESVPELKSYEDRSGRILLALTCCAVTSPLFGVGLTNTQSFSGLPHNDYVSILGDLGLVGLLPFVLILYAVFKCSRSRRLGSGAAAVWWVSLGTHAVIAALVVFFNTIDKFYTVQTFWLFAGLALVTGEIERSGTWQLPLSHRVRPVGLATLPPPAPDARVAGN